MTRVISVEDDRITRFVEEHWDDRVNFVKRVFNITPTEQQAAGLIAQDKQDNVTIRSGHGCGKSTVEAWTLWHYLTCRPFPKIPCTAPTKHQLYDVLWAECSKWYRQMNPIFRNLFQWTKERIFHVEHPEEWFATARTATKENPEALQGFHADYVLVIADEASGVPEEVFEVADGSHGRIETKQLLCGNHTRLTGTFHRSHLNPEERELWERLRWSCLDSPIAPEKFIERSRIRYGEASNFWRVRILGLEPRAEGDSYIPYDIANDAVSRDIGEQTEFFKVFGVDVARYGSDDTVIACRQGDLFHPYDVLHGKSTMEVANYIAHRANREKPHMIFIDVIGIGSGVYDRLEELGYPVYAVNVTETPAQSDSYVRLRDELWGNMRSWLEMRRGKMWDSRDGDLVAQLTTPRYKFMAGGKVLIESKDEMKKRGLISPNVADAHIMTFALPTMQYSRELPADEFDDEADRFKPFDREVGY